MREVLPELENWHRDGQKVALATVISVTGSAPRGVGACLAVNAGGQIAGSISGGCVEPEVIEVCRRALRTGETTVLKFGITEEQNVERIGLSCGGEIRVLVRPLEYVALLVERLEQELGFIQAIVTSGPKEWQGQVAVFDSSGQLLESSAPQNVVSALTGTVATALHHPVSVTRSLELEGSMRAELFIDVEEPPASLYIIGAGQISMALARMAKVCGYRVTIIDPRSVFATAERFPDADALQLDWPDDALRAANLSPASAVVVLTHDEKFDIPALQTALESSAGYIGAIGSRGTVQKRNARLIAAGSTEDSLSRIHAPIGLSIGAQTPEEIAVSILAEMIAVRRGRSRQVQSHPAQ